MDYDRVESLVSVVRNAKDDGAAQQALAELAAELKGYAWTQFQKKKWPFIRDCDFEGLYESALDVAVTRYDPRKGARFPTWCVRCLFYECKGEYRSRRKVEIDERQKQVSRLRSEPLAGPKDTCEEHEELRIMRDALVEESERSRQAVMAWSEGEPSAKELARIWKIKPGSIHKIRSRNLLNMRRYTRRQLKKE